VGDEQLMESIRSIDAFQVGGQFSLDSYRARLAGVGRSPAQFEADQRVSLQLGQVQGGVADSEFVTSSEARRFIELVEQTREVAAATLSWESFGAEAEISDDDVQAYYAQNQDRYMTPESVTLHYVEIHGEDLADEVQVDEQALRQYYDSVRGKYTTVERRRVRHILVEAGEDEEAAAAQARDIAERLAQGEDFAAVAAAESDDIATASSGGELGWLDPEVFDEPLSSVIFSLPVGQVSEPVRSAFGFHILRVDEIAPADVKSFEEVRADVEREYRQQESSRRFFERAETLAEQAFEHQGELDSAAEALGVQIQHLADFTREGAGPFQGNAQVIEAAFSMSVLEDGENSPIIELQDNHAMVLRVSDHRLPEPRPLEEVRAEIVTALQRERALELAQAAAAEILASVEQGASLEQAAQEHGAAYSAPRYVGRADAQLPPALVEAVFEAARPAGAPVSGQVALANGDVAVYLVSNVRPGQPGAMPPEMRLAGRQRLAEQMGQATFESYVQDLRDRASVQTFLENAEQLQLPQ